MTLVDEEHVPSPADAPEYTAEELLDHIAGRGGRIFRMPEVLVFCLTQDEQLAHWLMRVGGMPWTPKGMPIGASRQYRRGGPDSPWEWDIYIHTIPVAGEQTIHEAAAAFQHGKKVE